MRKTFPIRWFVGTGVIAAALTGAAIDAVGGPLLPGEEFLIEGTGIYAHSGDFDGDGINDVALEARAQGKLTTLHGEGGGDYAPWAGPDFRGLILAAGDFDGDGRDDLLSPPFFPWPGLAVLHSDGMGGFYETAITTLFSSEPPYISATVCQLDGGGPLDLVVVDSGIIVHALLGNGDGTFTESWARADVSAMDPIVAVADFDGDDHPDLLTKPAEGLVTIFPGLGDGTFGKGRSSSVRTGYQILGISDVDRNGALDVVVAAVSPYGTEVWLLPGIGDGFFEKAELIRGLGPCGRPGAGDWNADGLMDLACGNGSTTIRVLLGSAEGGFAQGPDVVTSRPSSVVGAAVTGCGDALVVATQPVTEWWLRTNIVVMPPSGASDEAGPIASTCYRNPRNVREANAGDLDGDGEARAGAVQSLSRER